MGSVAPPPYGLRLDGFYDGNEETTVTFSFDDVFFEEFSDGTANLFGALSRITNSDQGSRFGGFRYWLDVHFALITESDALAKIEDYNPEWRYYKMVPNGVQMLNMEDPSDFAFLWMYPKNGSKPFVVGNGANGKNAHFGAAGWLNFEHTIGGNVLGDRKKHLRSSDFLMDLDFATDVIHNPILRPSTFELSNSYPNPFNPSTTISYALPEAAHVRIEVINVLGAWIKTLVDGPKNAGQHAVRWDGTDHSGARVSSGTYLYRVAVDGYTQTRKMLLLK